MTATAEHSHRVVSDDAADVGELLTSRVAGSFTYHDLVTLSALEVRRLEVTEGGNLSMMSPSRVRHTRAIDDLRDWLREHGYDRERLEWDKVLITGERGGRVPDLIVVRDDVELGDDKIAFVPAETLVVLEVESPEPEDVDRDRVTKHRVYAHVGVPTYWRVEFDDAELPWLNVYFLDADGTAYGEAVTRRPLADVLRDKPAGFIRPDRWPG